MSGKGRPVHPLERLGQAAEEAQKRAEKEVVRCPDCGTTVYKDTIEAAVSVAESHDETMHDGERTAEINGMLAPSFSDEEKEQIQKAIRDLDTGSGRNQCPCCGRFIEEHRDACVGCAIPRVEAL